MFCPCLLVFGMWVDTEIPKTIICNLYHLYIVFSLRKKKNMFFFAINTTPRDNDFYMLLQSWTCMVEERLR